MENHASADDAAADLAALIIKDGDNYGIDGGKVCTSASNDDSSDLSSLDEDADVPPPSMKTTIFRRKNSDPSHLTKLGVNVLTYYPKDNLFIAHPVNSPTTPALVAKAPVPENGKGMPRPEMHANPKGGFKIVVLLRDHSQEANLRKLNIGGDAYQLVENGRRRYFFFLFKNKWEANLFSDLYHQASLRAPDSGSSDEDTSTADEGDDDDGFEASQDVFQIVRDYAKKKSNGITKIQPSIKEEDSSSKHS
eukprot:CAMPEP_0181045634 /NCGR_PEP_ID=MMETSP1070-20121207/13914_1 /TAXON_ID=265543 /ORGANISM="Minutocellus polymorphus, Strain NH13" /LENGTH=249 /DNA_ID=CAMNT_0023124179 /DNA_START=756 /DNA_END=1505 /DNA_ORIENTATION=+